MRLDRRAVVRSGVAASLLGMVSSSLTAQPVAAFKPMAGPRSRTLFVNDLCGDLDGLYALVHALLSPSTELRGIIGTGIGRAGGTAQASAALATEILGLMGMSDSVRVYEGAGSKMSSAAAPQRSPGAQTIIDEAMRTDTSLPLFVAVGGGLTEVASALLLEPRIADRITLVWIGGDSYPAGGVGETNFNIDPFAAQFVFNESTVKIWQVPRDVYKTTLVSASELQAFVAPHGAIGSWLYGKIVDAPLKFAKVLNMGETWTLGDSPLVALIALADWTPSGSTRPFRYENHGSSSFDEVIAPRLNSDGTFTVRSAGRTIRIYKTIDTRLMLYDMYAKLRIHYPSAARS
jgi:inosine-uridine nucleoside N-ribohydrolase